MSGEQQQPIESAVVVEEPSAGAAFMAGYDEDEDQHQPTETPAAATPEPTPAPTPAPSPQPKFVQITEDDWNKTNARAAKVDEIAATSGKRLDQAFGKMGDLERKVAELLTATPQGEAVAIGEADFDDLKKEYPEIGELTIRGLNKVLSKFKGTGGAAVDTAAIEKIIDQRVSQARAEDRQAMIDERLSEVLPQWKKEINSPEFDTWLTASKGWDARLKDKAFVNANLADETSPLSKWVQANPDEPVSLYLSKQLSGAEKLLRTYDAARKPAATPAPSLAPAPAQLTIRQRQIAAAVPPKGDSGTPPNPKGKSPFLAGFEEDD